MNEETKIYLVQETRYARVVARYYDALLNGYFSVIRKPPHKGSEDVLRIGAREFSRIKIRQELTNFDPSVIPPQFEEFYNRRVDWALHSIFVDEMASILESNPPGKPQGLNLATILTILEDKKEILKELNAKGEDRLADIRRANNLSKKTIAQFRTGRNATHHAYANDFLTLSRTKKQGDVSAEVVQHIYNILNMIGVSIFNEAPLPEQDEYFFQLWKEKPLDTLIWCYKAEYISETEHAIQNIANF